MRRSALFARKSSLHAPSIAWVFLVLQLLFVLRYRLWSGNDAAEVRGYGRAAGRAFVLTFYGDGGELGWIMFQHALRPSFSIYFQRFLHL